jgi:hypothetical protein
VTLPGILSEPEPAPTPVPRDDIERALTLTQPWAGLIVTGVKCIENRPWKLPKNMAGKRFAVHASREVDEATVDYLKAMGIPEHPLWRVTGAVVGVARATGYVSSLAELEEATRAGRAPADSATFWMGPFAFLLADQRPIATPVVCKGALGFWGFSESLAKQISEQLEAA